MADWSTPPFKSRQRRFALPYLASWRRAAFAFLICAGASCRRSFSHTFGKPPAVFTKMFPPRSAAAVSWHGLHLARTEGPGIENQCAW